MSDIAKHVTDDTGPGLYVTRYRNPHDGHQYVGPQIKAASRAWTPGALSHDFGGPTSTGPGRRGTPSARSGSRGRTGMMWAESVGAARGCEIARS